MIIIDEIQQRSNQKTGGIQQLSKPKLDEIEKLLQQGKDFFLTDAQYEKLTGIPLPKDSYYLKNRSALAKIAKNADYVIEVIEKRVILTKK